MANTKKNKYDAAHLRNLTRYRAQVDAIYRTLTKEAAAIASGIDTEMPEDLFSFSDYPKTMKRVDALIEAYKADMMKVVVNGVKSEWTLANNKNNEIARQVFGDKAGKLTPEQERRYYTNNDTARQAFLDRKERGLNLSDRVWDYSGKFRKEIEMGVDLCLRKGMPAAEMARELQKYLRHPDELYRRVRDQHGNLTLSKAAKDFHPGRGVYRSSYKNALRLAITETNMAYRLADWERWQQMDFVVGIRIQLSNNHTCLGKDGEPHPFHDICDELAGEYPKSFKWVGWHPQCRCNAVPILKTVDEKIADNLAKRNGQAPAKESVNSVTEKNSGGLRKLNEWLEANKERAKGWSSMPYFVRDNPQYIKGFEVDTYTPYERKFTQARSTSPAMKEAMGKFLQSRYPNIPNTGKAVIFHYTRGDISAFRRLNKEIREGKLSEFNIAFSSLLSSALAKLEPVQATVYRTIRLNKTQLGNWLELAERKGEIKFDGFTSTSLKRSIPERMMRDKSARKSNETDVLLVLESKTGKHIEELSQFSGRFDGKPNQYEVLFDKGGRFRFEKFEKINGNIVFYLSED